LNRDERRRRIAESLEIVGLTKRMYTKIRTYSKGMKQRLGIAQSFFHDPEVIFLDEPTDGVDPVGRKEIRDLLVQLKAEGRTIFVNSHLLGEVEMISDRVAILHQGEVVRQGTVNDLTRQDGRYVVGLAPGEKFPTEEVARLGYKTELVGDVWEVLLGESKDGIDQVLAVLTEKGVKLRHLVEKKQTLEDVFVRMVDEADPTAGRRPRVARPVAARRVDR
jgi:ABC-2 type transport system ATP-binding protein